jgi:hypothetical protein
VAFAARCPSANEQSQEHPSTQDEHNDGDEHRDEDGERARSTVLMRDAEQKHGRSSPHAIPTGTADEILALTRRVSPAAGTLVDNCGTED